MEGEEEDIERFKVRHQLKGLRSRFGLRRFRLYITDEKVYLVETYIGWGSEVFWPGIPFKILLTPILARMWEKEYDSLKDIRFVMGQCIWYKRYMKDELKAIWIEPGDFVNKLVLLVELKEERKEFYNVSGEGCVYFKSKQMGEVLVKLQKAFPERFMGIREDQKE